MLFIAFLFLNVNTLLIFSDGISKPIYRSRKECYKRQRSQMTVPFKKRKLFDRSPVWNSDGGINDWGFFNSTEKGIGDASNSCAKLQGDHSPKSKRHALLT